MDKKAMVEALIAHYTGGNKAQFAKLLGLSPQTMSAWTTRHTFDATLVYTKCRDVNPAWLLTGEGSMLKTNGSMNDTPSQSVTVVDSKGTKNNSNNQGNKQQSVDATAFLSFIKEKDAAHEAVIKEKDTIIEQKNQEIKQLQREIGRLEGELKRVSASDTNISTDAQMANAV